MGQLRALQEDLKKLLFIGDKEPVRSAFWGANIPQRLGVYRNNVHLNWLDTLNDDFPLTKKQFESEEWESLTHLFFTKHPPQHWELNTSVIPFVKFLGSQKIKPYIKELADYELTDLLTFLHPATPLKRCGFTNPTFTTRVYQHQIFDWVDLKASPKKPPRQKPEVLVFYRDTKLVRHIQKADPLMLLVLEHYRKPNAKLYDLESARKKLLPGNNIPLEVALRELHTCELVLN